MIEKFIALNGDVKISYLRNQIQNQNPISGSHSPLVYIPGMLGSAEEFPFSAFSNRDCLAISLRGRGYSDCPDKGYTFEDHVADIETVITDSKIGGSFCMMAFSRGAAYALGLAARRPEVLKGLIICDFPARYERFSSDWLERCLSNPNTKPHVVKAIFEETEEVTLWEQLANIQCPVLVIRGGKEGSLLSAEDAELYKIHLKDVEIVVFEESGHAVWEQDEARFLSTVHEFLQKIDAGCIKNYFTNITWSEKTDLIDDIIREIQEVQFNHLPAGLEAEVVRISSDKVNAVLKIWNKDSSPDVGFQYALLDALRERGVSVSTPFGWGFDAANCKILVTSFDGSPISKVGEQKMKDLARLLSELHKIPVDELEPALHKKYDFIEYFFPRLNDNHDIRKKLVRLVEKSGLKQDRMIHGDYNLWNILENNGKYTVIDWTNAQLGDPRYDAAWSSFLIRIYNGDDLYSCFLNAYLAQSDCLMEEIEIFEAIACLRWLLLNRIVDLPKYEVTIVRINNMIKKNNHLDNEFMINHG